MRSAALLVITALAACDPGGSYHVPGGTEVMDNGRRFDLAGKSDTSLRAYASWFTGSLDIELAITNHGSTPLVIHPDKLRVSDREGPLQSKFDPQRVRCTGRDTEETVTLNPGEACAISASYGVHVDRARLRTITLIHDGVTRDGVAVPVVVKFELDR